MTETDKKQLLTGSIFAIKKYSIHDGPGIRTTIFFKGCPLTCWWCHNPEGLGPDREIIIWPQRCIQCGECIKSCPQHAVLRSDSFYRIDKEKCIIDGVCAESCPANAREVVGKEISVTSLLEEIEKDTIFYDESGGGVTFSGGEPFFQPRFLLELLKQCRYRKIDNVVDTCGYVDTHTLLEVAEFVDLFLYDLKFIDDNKHKQYTGVSNKLILSNLRTMVKFKKSVIVRIPVIPGINDDSENINQTGQFIDSLKTVKQVDLLPFHEFSTEKYRRLDKAYQLIEMKSLPDHRMQEIKCELEKYNFEICIGG